MSCFVILLKTELQSVWSQKFQFFSSLSFALLSLFVFSLAMGQSFSFSPALLWVLLLFTANLMSFSIWEEDLQDGTLEQLSSLGVAFEFLMLTKLIRQGLLLFLSAMSLFAIYIVMFHVKHDDLFVVIWTFFLGIPGVSVLSVLSQLLTLGSRANRFMGTLLSLPLMLPTLLFSCGALREASVNQGAHPLWLLLASSLFLIPVCVFIGVFALQRIVQE